MKNASMQILHEPVACESATNSQIEEGERIKVRVVEKVMWCDFENFVKKRWFYVRWMIEFWSEKRLS